MILDAFLEKAVDTNGDEVSFVLRSQQTVAEGRQLTSSVSSGMYCVILIAPASECCTAS